MQEVRLDESYEELMSAIVDSVKVLKYQTYYVNNEKGYLVVGISYGLGSIWITMVIDVVGVEEGNVVKVHAFLPKPLIKPKKMLEKAENRFIDQMRASLS